MNRLSVLVVGLAIVLATGVARADETIRDGAARLLEIATKNTPPAVATAREEYEKLKEDDPADPRIDYVYGVALLNQRRYADALPLVARYLEDKPDDAAALAAKIWAQIHLRRHAEAFKDAVTLSQKFPDSAEAQAPAPWEQTARFLGAVFGYFELVGPAADDKLLPSAKREVLANLKDTYQSSFDQGRNEVAKRLAELENQQQERQARTVQKIEAQQAGLEEAIEGDRQRIAAGTEAVQASAEELREAQRKLGVLRTQLGSLEQERARVGAQIVSAQAQLLKLQQELETDRSENRRTSVDTVARSVRLSLVLAALNKQAIEMDQRLLALRADAQAAATRAGEESQTLSASQTAVRTATRRAEALEKQARRLEGKRPARPAHTTEMTRFSTYVPFPFEEEKKRVLGWFEE